jgi:hypothetical protein
VVLPASTWANMPMLRYIDRSVISLTLSSFIFRSQPVDYRNAPLRLCRLSDAGSSTRVGATNSRRSWITPGPGNNHSIGEAGLSGAHDSSAGRRKPVNFGRKPPALKSVHGPADPGPGTRNTDPGHPMIGFFADPGRAK